MYTHVHIKYQKNETKKTIISLFFFFLAVLWYNPGPHTCDIGAAYIPVL